MLQPNPFSKRFVNKFYFFLSSSVVLCFQITHIKFRSAVPMEFLGTMRDLVQWFDDNNCRAGRAQPLETDPSEIKDDNWQWPAFGKVKYSWLNTILMS